MDKLYFTITTDDAISRAVGLVTASDLGDENIKPDISLDAVKEAIETSTDRLVNRVQIAWETHPYLYGTVVVRYEDDETDIFTIQQTWLF